MPGRKPILSHWVASFPPQHNAGLEEQIYSFLSRGCKHLVFLLFSVSYCMMAIPKKRTSTRVLFKEITLEIKTSGFEVGVWRAEKLLLYYQYHEYPESLWVTDTSNRSGLKGGEPLHSSAYGFKTQVPRFRANSCLQLAHATDKSEVYSVGRFCCLFGLGFVFLSCGSFFLLTRSILETILVFSVHSSLSQVHVSLDYTLPLMTLFLSSFLHISFSFWKIPSWIFILLLFWKSERPCALSFVGISLSNNKGPNILSKWVYLCVLSSLQRDLT